MAVARSVYDLVAQELGYPVTEVETDTTVGLTVAELMGQNPRRLAFVIVNLSTGNLFVRPRGQASSTAGIRIASAGTLSVWYKEDYTLPAQRWSIVGDAAGLAYTLIELIMEGVP